VGKFFSLHQERFYISVQTQLSQVDLFDVCVLLEVVYKTKIIQCLHLMSISNKYAYVLKMGYKPSDPVDFDFFMAVPCGCLNPQSIYSVGCILHMVNNLHSIGITMILQRLYQELGMLFVFLEQLMSDTTFLILKDVIHIIRGGPLLDIRFFRQIRLPQFIQYGQETSEFCSFKHLF